VAGWRRPQRAQDVRLRKSARGAAALERRQRGRLPDVEHAGLFVRNAHIMAGMETGIANLLGALSLAVMDRIEQGAREVVGRGGETPAALVVIGYGQGMTNDTLRRILGLSHSGTVRLVDRLVSDQLVERRPGKDGREIACISRPRALRPGTS
jgi:hypothetical protein